MKLINNTEKLILASSSKIRATLLQNAGLSFQIQPADIDELSIIQKYENDSVLNISGVAEVLAIEKAKKISQTVPDAYVIGCDQILGFCNKMYSKPKDYDESFARLKNFSGKTHQLHTSVSLVKDKEKIWSYSEVVDMQMRELSDNFIEAYLKATGEQVFKSVGAYQLEDIGVQLFQNIKGNYFTILGIPLLPLLETLRKEGVINQ